MPPTGLRTPSPTKSRLPLGSSLPQRSVSVKGLSNVSLQPPARKISTKDPEVIKKPAVSRTRLRQNDLHTENHPPNLTSGQPSRINHPIGQLAPTASPTIPSSISVPQNLVFSRANLEPRLELLHLHTIHKSSLTNQAQWQEHAFHNYKRQFEALQNRNQDLNQLEMETLAQKNASTILSWYKQGNGLGKQIYALSSVITGVEHLTSTNGKYTLVIQAFEHWIASATSLQGQRAQPSNKIRSRIIEGLGDGWLAEVESMQSSLITFADTMLDIDGFNSGESDLERTITVISEMLKNMLEELDMILTLETTIVQEERDWIEGSIATINRDLNDGLSLR